jgi:hypothetical protein
MLRLGVTDQASQRDSGSPRFFSLARWSLEELGLAAFWILDVWLPEGTFLLALDGTLAAKCSLQVLDAGRLEDPQPSSRRAKTLVVQARISFSTSPPTSVRRKSRPLKRYVSFA